ncbi:MAG: IS605 OrfB-like transposable element containing RNAse H-like and Zn finger domain [Candidatus Methanohalarchaeum thermophilum]|uniref:IS605 OrfB-like transposable element containing RNAse H-like and Zn finger domain n=1 Tax=Methanohalarchaeum thermophilum TaxID=1903181 RepID=A0A1Q6DTY2_METT1|nr:MAG: IS605 OrfB-like transposable element containing RNAse H-like and Zn finger domain [Candidatus Methanohalarchaeum thermophilum]
MFHFYLSARPIPRKPVIDVVKRVGRPSSKEFRCSECGLEVQADRNGAVNIKERGLDKLDIEPLSKSGASLAMPETPEPDINLARAKQ